ncbi:hypothetical protein BASA81_005992 [Batrachochytrium salamandrivorans]|nr:hypothetical protein BASA81_005992 [Batrachochytrium salamandrivorans]
MKRDLVKIKEALAMHCYLTETVFSRIEEKRTCSVHLESVDLIIVLPDRKKLGGALLDSCYAKVKSVVDNHTEEMKLNACLTSDVWSNIKNEPIVNYMLISDSSAFFLESVSTGKQSHNAKWIAQDMGRIIDSLAGKIKAQLQKAQLTENLPGLVQPAPTRWSSLKTCFESLRKSEHVLHRIVSAKDFIQGTGKQKESQQKIHDIITDGKFVEHLEKAIMILNPVNTTIVVFQSDSVPVSQIYQSFANTMKEQYEMMNCLSDAERFYLLQLLQSRLDFLYGDAIGIA